jgi:Arc/MetJ-type ribon-helix-helix transcriptional regulator
MRRTINISVPEEMYNYIAAPDRFGSVSEYIRSLVEHDRQRREDYASRPRLEPMRANDCVTIGAALVQLDKLQAILEGR